VGSFCPNKNALLNRQSENDRSCLLKDLVSLCCKYNTIINNLPCLATDIKKVAQPIALRELLTIEGKKEITIPWKKEILNHILRRLHLL
jgi:hypothetical protein